MTDTRDERRIVRNESTPTGKRIWEAVDRAAEKAPQKVKDRLRTPTAGSSEPVKEVYKRMNDLYTTGVTLDDDRWRLAMNDMARVVYAHPVPEDSESEEVERLKELSIPDEWIRRYHNDAAFNYGINALCHSDGPATVLALYVRMQEQLRRTSEESEREAVEKRAPSPAQDPEPSPHEYEDGECIRCGCVEYPPEVCVPVEARTVSRPEPRGGDLPRT